MITAPRDNIIAEAFKFSSRHSEFIKLRAEALLSDAAPNGQDAQYKVVVQYPDGTHSTSLLGLKREPGQQIFKIDQFIELMQNTSWTEASLIDIYIAEDLPYCES